MQKEPNPSPDIIVQQSLRRLVDAAHGTPSPWLANPQREVVNRAVKQLLARPPVRRDTGKSADTFSPFIYPH
jgi:hypothetical protein